MYHFIALTYICAVLFLPIVPAYLIYKLLPSETSVRGPFKGVNVNLKGAFSGYFLLVLVASGFAVSALSPSKPSYEVWQITGKVQPSSLLPNAAKGASDLAGVTIGVTPPSYSVGSGGDFSMTVVVMPGHIEGKRFFPTLVFNRPGYAGVVLPLSATTDTDVEVDENIRLLKVKTLVTMDRLQQKTEELQWAR